MTTTKTTSLTAYRQSLLAFPTAVLAAAGYVELVKACAAGTATADDMKKLDDAAQMLNFEPAAVDSDISNARSASQAETAAVVARSELDALDAEQEEAKREIAGLDEKLRAANRRLDEIIGRGMGPRERLKKPAEIRAQAPRVFNPGFCLRDYERREAERADGSAARRQF